MAWFLNVIQLIKAAMILPVPLQVLADKDSLLDEVVQVFRDLWGQALSLEHTEDLVASDKPHLRNTMTVSEDHT